MLLRYLTDLLLDLNFRAYLANEAKEGENIVKTSDFSTHTE